VLNAAAYDWLCENLPASQVWDTQWSGNLECTIQSFSSFSCPFSPDGGRRICPESGDDYWRLKPTMNGRFDLELYNRAGVKYDQLAGGRIELANENGAFFVIDGWYGTLITIEPFGKGGSTSLSGLALDPPVSCVAGSGATTTAASSGSTTTTVLNAAAYDWLCENLPASQVWDTQWSGNLECTIQSFSSFSCPFSPDGGRRICPESGDDYWRLKPTMNGRFDLELYNRAGVKYDQLAGGRIELANENGAFFVIDGWYGTLITIEPFGRGGSTSLSGLVLDPPVSCVATTSTSTSTSTTAGVSGARGPALATGALMMAAMPKML